MQVIDKWTMSVEQRQNAIERGETELLWQKRFTFSLFPLNSNNVWPETES